MQKNILQAKRWETDSQVIRKMAEQMKKLISWTHEVKRMINSGN